MSNHTLLTMGAFILLTSILLGFYNLLGSTGSDITEAQDLILATTMATSYIELAQGLSFDSVTDTSSLAIGNPSILTKVHKLGPEPSEGDDSIAVFNDFDDFNGLTVERQATGVNKRFTADFAVHYVDPDDVDSVSPTETFVKRMNLRVWRSFPAPSMDESIDTLRVSFILGYFHFD
jgi:hypothetical protein